MTNTKDVLVVDDEPDIRTYLATLLADAGFSTRTAADGVEALALVRQARFDLITLDVTMPEKSGVRFYRDLKESAEWRSIPVIIVTGVSGEFERFISTRKQVPAPEGYLRKPIEPTELVALARRLTG